MPSWRLTLPRWRKDDQTVALRGSKSRNKVSVGEPAEGSLQEFGPPCLNTLFFSGLVGCLLGAALSQDPRPCLPCGCLGRGPWSAIPFGRGPIGAPAAQLVPGAVTGRQGALAGACWVCVCLPPGWRPCETLVFFFQNRSQRANLIQCRAVDQLARESMKNAAKCAT